MTTAFPGLPLDIQAEFYTAGQWRSLVSDIREKSAINITRGVTDESTTAVASTCTFQLNNGPTHGNGNYDPNNPLGAYYGSIGRGTPFRCGVRTGQDQFGRIVSNGWGTADTGGAWSTGGAGGTVQASDFSVASGVGKHSVPATNANRLTYLAANVYDDVDVAVTCTVLSGTNVAGAPVEFGPIVHYQTSTTFYFSVRGCINADQTVSVGIFGVTTAIVAYTVVPGLTHSTNSIRVRGTIEGGAIRGKVWDAALPEPQDWQVTGIPYGLIGPEPAGYVGVRSGVTTGNTNTLPVVFSYDDFQVRIPRYAGTVASIVPTASDIAGKDQYTAVTVAGALRRVSQSTSTLQSALRRSIPTLPNIVAYWPCEDGTAATSLASGLTGGVPMAIPGFPSLASYTGFACSAPIPTMAAAGTTSALVGTVPQYAATGSWQVRCLVFAANGVAGSTMLRVTAAGTAQTWDVSFTSGGGINLTVYDQGGTVLLNSTIGFAINNLMFRLSLQAAPSGADIAYTVSVLPIGSSQVASYANGTLTAHTAASVAAVSINPFAQCGAFAFGHVTVESAVTDIFALVTQLNAYVGEDAGTRFVRLCTENGIVGDYQGDTYVQPALMGAQLANSLGALLQECADADRGIFYEPRGAPNALSYKALGAHYNQPVTLALSTSTNDVGTYPAPTFDDQNTHNVVTVMRPSGSSVTAQQTTGALGTNTVAAPTQQITANVNADGQLNDLATWIVHLGTTTDPRFPPLMLNLLRPGNSGLMIPAANVDVDDRITLAGLYPDVSSMLARGYTEMLAGHMWTITFNCSPESPFEIFTLDDTVLGRLDSDTSTLHDTTITSGAASFQVDVTDGTLWTTNSGDWPVLIRMGGEVMSVASISGATSPQTFSSVTRAVNGVAKAHAHGEQITVAQPCYLALGRP